MVFLKIWPKYCKDFCSVAQYRAKILTIYSSYFGRNHDFINPFWNLLTFSRSSPFLRGKFEKCLRNQDKERKTSCYLSSSISSKVVLSCCCNNNSYGRSFTVTFFFILSIFGGFEKCIFSRYDTMKPK